ncbi:mediator of RNA polymerase II transcription subunit 17-like isoform X2 [Littorina saxatilis]|uniref:mediator of RNA polymerase II transcription subunit 17-like isoform X2 n=1 Tax=Littorina saxatilis TaxID=31220 RepID=UPI0038B4C4AF
MAGSSVKVSVEALQEHQIQEVTLDGQEIYVQQLSMSENLTKLAHKIDFFKDESDGKGKPASEGEKEVAEDKQLAPFMPSLWPWDTVRNHLKCGLTEMSVLLDVLNLVKEKQYLVADPASQDTPDTRPAVQLLAKKKSLVAASSVLLSGAERLKKSHCEASKKTNDFHTELSTLRKIWRLKKVSTNIVGDLSYRSAGSRFWQGGSFEVRKSVEGEQAETEGEGGAARATSLEVTVPSELEGVAYIQVEVKTVPDMMDLTSSALKMPPGLSAVPTNAYWQSKLESAQNVLFCKELFAQLAREAVQVKSATPHMVIGNQIITNVFPGHQLSIVLCHYTGKEKRVPPSNTKLEHNHVLEHSLHQLLHEVHHRNVRIDAPHPVNATYGMTKRRRIAGPAALTRQDMIHMADSESLLSQIIKQTKHAVLRIRCMHVIDQMAVSIQDPQITAHWGCLNSALQSSVRIFITSAGYESLNTLSRTSIVLLIGVDTIRVVMKDGRTCQLSFEDKELQDLLLWQIAQHHTSVVQQIDN